MNPLTLDVYPYVITCFRFLVRILPFYGLYFTGCDVTRQATVSLLIFILLADQIEQNYSLKFSPSAFFRQPRLLCICLRVPFFFYYGTWDHLE